MRYGDHRRDRQISNDLQARRGSPTRAPARWHTASACGPNAGAAGIGVNGIA
jgi:hypothetical protein